MAIMEEVAAVDEKQAQDALASAEALASRMRRKNPWHVTVVFILGLAMLALTLTYGLLIEPGTNSTTAILLLIPFFALVIYTARQPVVPRHHRTLYSIITALGAGIYTITVVFGAVFFPGAPWWWIPGAFLCAMPFFLVGLLNIRARRDGQGPL